MHPPEITGEPPDVWAAFPVASRRKFQAEELEQEMVRVLAHARGEVLDDAEVQKFRQLHGTTKRFCGVVRHQETPHSGASCYVMRSGPLRLKPGR